MRIGIFSDIHSNFEALRAVLEDMLAKKVTHTVCLGDVVGYNANPAECLRVVRELGCPVVQGNHDNDVGREEDPEHVNRMAGEGIAFSKNALTQEERQYLSQLPSHLQFEGVTFTHDTLDGPGSWNYINSVLEAEVSFHYQRTQLCFYGHTHVPRIFVKSYGVRETQVVRRFEFRKGERYLINPGSVGQPRDGDWRAAYAVLDLKANCVEFLRVEYDIETAQRKILAAGLPEKTSQRLRYAH